MWAERRSGEEKLMSDKDSKRKKLYDLQHGRCIWCGEKLLSPDDTRTGDPLYPTLDHLISKAVGGKGGDNLRVACQACNSLRGTVNTGLWLQQQQTLKDAISRQGKTIHKLKEFILTQQAENKRLTNSLHKLIEDYEPWWKFLRRICRLK